MSAQPDGPGQDYWKYGEPESDDVFEALQPLFLPEGYHDEWCHYFERWARRMNVTCLALRRAERQHATHSRTVDEGIDRIKGFFVHLCRDAFALLLLTKAKDNAINTAFSMDYELPEDPELTPEFKGDLQPLWQKLRQELIGWLKKIDNTARQIQFVQPLTAVLREIRTLASTSGSRGVGPEIRLCRESSRQSVRVIVGGKSEQLTPTAAWFLATCGLPGFEDSCYRNGSIKALIKKLREAGWTSIEGLVGKRDCRNCQCAEQTCCYSMDKSLRSMIKPEPGPELTAFQEFCRAKIEAKRAR